MYCGVCQTLVSRSSSPRLLTALYFFFLSNKDRPRALRDEGKENEQPVPIAGASVTLRNRSHGPRALAHLGFFTIFLLGISMYMYYIMGPLPPGPWAAAPPPMPQGRPCPPEPHYLNCYSKSRPTVFFVLFLKQNSFNLVKSIVNYLRGIFE